MWSAIGNGLYSTVAAVGNIAVATGTYVGISGGEYPKANLPSNYPFTRHENNEERHAWCHSHLYAEYIRVVDGPEWTPLAFADPDEATDGGDIRLFTRPQDQTHHFMKATFTLKNGATPEKVMALVASESLEERQRFGPNMEHCDYYWKSPCGTTSLLNAKFWAPPPTAGRDFQFLQGKKVHEDGTVEVWGCSVTDDMFPEDGYYYVRGASFWGWRVGPPSGADGSCFLTYFNVSDPRGWCPSWIFSFIKSQVSKDLVMIRNVIHGKDVKATKVALEDIGLSAEEVTKEQEKVKAEEKTQRSSQGENDAGPKA